MIQRKLAKFKTRIDEYKADIDSKDYIANYPDFPKS